VIEKHVAEGQALFILDGLDEVTDTAHRREIAAQIVRLIETHVRDAHGRTPLDPSGYANRMPIPGDEPARGGGGQLIVTSRIVGYQVHPLPAELDHFVIQPMDDTAVRRFCQAWTTASGGPAEAEPLQEAVLSHPNARVRDEMARNPLLLTVLAQVFETSPGGRLPHRRAELYEQAAQAVFDQRHEQWERLAADLESRDFVRIMTRLTAHVALQLHANPDYPASLAEEESVRDWLAEAVAQEQALLKARRVDDVVEDILEAARELSGFFIARGQGVYGFVHRQFQEYFAAKALMVQPDAQEIFLQRLADPVWREVLLLGVALSGQRAAHALLQAALEAPDPTGGLLPHNVLFVAAALRELERPPSALVRRVAAGLIRAYRRDDEGRFAALHERVERAFAALPRSVGRSDPVGDALCAALQTSKVLGELVRTTSEVSRLTRLAAAELVIKYEWYTPTVTKALAEAWQAHLEPAGTLLAALASAHAAHPEHFSRRFLCFRRAVEKERDLWAAVQAHAHWATVVRALYLAPWADLETEAIVRDSALTPGLLPLLRERPEDGKELRDSLIACFEGGTPGGKQRDAGLALAYLGDTAIVPALVESRGEDRTLTRAILAAMTLDRALTRAGVREIITQKALSSALEKARLLERSWVHTGGVLTVWVALGKAWEAQPPSLAEWAAAGRPALDGARLAALNAALEARAGEGIEGVDWPDVLPRLDSTPLAKLNGEVAQTARTHLARWLASFEGKAAPIARHGALLLAEMGHVTSQTVPLLCACLRDGSDLTRYRAQAATNRQRPASALGRETIERMARCYHCAGDAAARASCIAVQAGAECWRGLDVASAALQTPEAWLADTYLDWSLKEIEHDRPDWLHAWTDANNTGILGRVHHLDDASWPIFLELLEEAAPPVRKVLLDSASWLLRLGRVPKAHLEALTACLLTSLGSDEHDVQQGAVDALGHLPQPTESVLARLQTLRVLETLRVYTALARLAGRAGDADRAAIETTLRAALPLEEAAGALIRLRVTQAGEDFDPAVVLPTLSQDISDPDDLLAALLRAGTDNDGWDDFHERIVALVRELVEKSDRVPLGNLLAALETALDGDEWPPKRIALAAVAACAEVMPETLNNALPRVDLEAMLIESARVADSFTARRQAVNTLSHLHTATPAAIAALLAASRDVAAVQQDAVAAAARFQHFASDFAEADALDPLVTALHGESAAGAYVAARLLAALGSAPAAVEVPELRERISGILSEALRKERVKRDVYLLEPSGWWTGGPSPIEHKGALAQALFDALVQVAGLPE
jgi:hypothetical protein